MSKFIAIALLLLGTGPLFAQDTINPYTIQQRSTIELHHTDVYYNPFAPPGDSDTREKLCNESDLLNDPNGVGSRWRLYQPIIYDTTHGRDTFVYLEDWAPHGTPIGKFTVWQRLFQAMPGSDGTPHDIIAGGDSTDTVTISKNEDVDFRASGTIKLKNGFHARAGCFFHAYQAPKWDTAVFSDEFSDSAKFRNQWYVANGYGGSTSGAPATEVQSDSNVQLVTDPDAHDGYALDLMMRMDTDTGFTCYQLKYSDTGCSPLMQPDSSTFTGIFSTSFIRSCPFPYTSVVGGLGPPTYGHAPYGKYESRVKVPDVLFHTNNWGSTWDMEYDMNETPNSTMGAMCPGIGRPFFYGPDTGFFQIRGAPYNDTIFISHDAGWTVNNNNPTEINIDGYVYVVSNSTVSGYNFVKDTCTPKPGDLTELSGGFPSALVTSGHTFSFYCRRYPGYYADTVTWTVTQNAGQWDVLHAPYHVVSPGDSLFFSKDYQPERVTLTTRSFPLVQKTFACRWDHTLNAILLNPYNSSDSLLSTDLHTFTESYPYELCDLYTPYGYGYPVPAVFVNGDTVTPEDTAALPSVPYKYHTFTMEFLPHEIRYLYDSMVVRRIPDRLIPPSNKYADFITKEPRSPASLLPSEFDLDLSSNDPFGDTANYWGQYERSYFAAHPYVPGCGDVTIDGKPYHAAHERLDYVKVFDVPKDVVIPNFSY